MVGEDFEKNVFLGKLVLKGFSLTDTSRRVNVPNRESYTHHAISKRSLLEVESIIQRLAT